MTKSEYQYFLTSSGLRIIYLHTDSNVEYCGVDVAVGSRNEVPENHGMAHFIEHTLFKGTKSHKANFISNCMEQVGGELNAYTTKDETVIYSTFPKGNANRAISLIADLVINSVFPQEQLDRERYVVLDEIDSYRDTPSEAIYDDFEEYLFENTPMAHNILGSRATIETFDSEKCREFMNKYYTAANMVFFYMGPTTAKKILYLVEKHFAEISKEYVNGYKYNLGLPVSANKFIKTCHIDSHQAHTVIGTSLPGANSKLRYPIALLTNILGGPGMNARLNTVLREQKGLVYTIEASTSFFNDCGEFTIYFGCDTEDVDKCKKLIFREIEKYANTALTKTQLDKARKQYLGQLIVAGENKEQLALSTAHEYLYNVMINHNNPAPVSSHLYEMNAITPNDILEAAQLIKSEHLSVLTYK